MECLFWGSVHGEVAQASRGIIAELQQVECDYG